MSRAKPMGAERRAANQGLRNTTPRQWRRWRHKYNRANGGYFGHWGEDCKGQPTPRQRARKAATP